MLPGNEYLNDTWTYINEFHNTKNRLLTVSTLGVCGGSEITVNSFYFGMVCWS